VLIYKDKKEEEMEVEEESTTSVLIEDPTPTEEEKTTSTSEETDIESTESDNVTQESTNATPDVTEKSILNEKICEEYISNYLYSRSGAIENKNISIVEEFLNNEKYIKKIEELSESGEKADVGFSDLDYKEIILDGNVGTAIIKIKENEYTYKMKVEESENGYVFSIIYDEELE
jgi:hypothetical protein